MTRQLAQGADKKIFTDRLDRSRPDDLISDKESATRACAAASSDMAFLRTFQLTMIQESGRHGNKISRR
jgi:hypothetical protein